MTKLLALFVIALFITHSCFAQESPANTSDTLSKEELALLKDAEKNSFIGYMNLADSFSIKKDSINTGRWLLKVSPYYFMFNGIKPNTVDSILTHYFLLLATDRKQYELLFNEAYQARSETYQAFERMVAEDQQIRYVQNHAADSFTYATAEKRMHRLDSTHFAYLYNYVEKNGWPSMENGSLCAELLAVHDHAHHHYYIPQLRKAVLNHQAIISGLQLMISWQNQRLSTSYLLKQIDTSKKMVFVLPTLLKYELPSIRIMNRIEKAVKIHCPVKIILAYKCRNDKIFSEWNDKSIQIAHKHDTDDILMQLMKDIYKYCPTGYWPKGTKDINWVLWKLWYLPSDENNFYLYVLYK